MAQFYDDDRDELDELEDLDELGDDFHEEDDAILLEEPVREPIAIATVIEALSESENSDGSVTDTLFYGLSGLSDDDVAALRPVWEALDPVFRLRLLGELAEASETSYEVDYTGLGRMAMTDPAAEVRAEAISVMWHDQSLSFMRELMYMAQHDPGDPARASALSALGAFILSGELDDLPIDQTNEAQALAAAIYHDADESIEVRRRALEALSNSSNDNVNPAIEMALASDDLRMQISAVHAMGKSCDDRWQPTVLDRLNGRGAGSGDPEMIYEAVKAAGELQISRAVPILGRLAASDDTEIQEAAIWSLGEIGGDSATRILTNLLSQAQEDEDEGLIETIEEAIGNASVLDGSFTMLKLDD